MDRTKLVVIISLIVVSIIFLTVYERDEGFYPGLVEDPERCFEEIDDRVEQQKCVVTVAGNQDDIGMCGYIEEGFEDFEVLCRARIKGEKELCGEIVDPELESRCVGLIQENLG